MEPVLFDIRKYRYMILFYFYGVLYLGINCVFCRIHRVNKKTFTLKSFFNILKTFIFATCTSIKELGYIKIVILIYIVSAMNQYLNVELTKCNHHSSVWELPRAPNYVQFCFYSFLLNIHTRCYFYTTLLAKFSSRQTFRSWKELFILMTKHVGTE